MISTALQVNVLRTIAILYKELLSLAKNIKWQWKIKHACEEEQVTRIRSKPSHDDECDATHSSLPKERFGL